MTSHWYSIRTKPGHQRVASVDLDLPQPRHHEFVIERAAREKGYDIFTPSFWLSIVHHRKKTLITKRIPLFTGYSFVRLPNYDFEKLRDVEGVLCVLRDSRGPAMFGDEIISRLVFNDWQERQDMLFAAYEKEELERQQKITQIRAKLRKALPKGRAVRVNMLEEASKKIESLPPKTRDYVKDLMKTLEELTATENVGEAA